MSKSNKNKRFDLNRQINYETLAEEMAEAEIAELRKALEAMQIQHQHQIQNLQETMATTLQQQQQQHQRIPAQPTLSFELTADQILTEFQKIKTFFGNNDYPLQEFIMTVENVAKLCNTDLLKYGLSIVYREKIQGVARRCIQR